MNPPNETDALVGAQTLAQQQRETSVDCPKCGQAIFIEMDTRPDGKIVCDACNGRFKNYDTLIRAVEAQRAAKLRQPATIAATAISCDLIDPNPHQPRQDFDPARLEELASSIREHGLIQPIVVEPNGDRFTLHAGERRLRAAKLIGWAKIPAYIVPPGSNPKTLLVRAVVENVQRADMNPLELARAFQEMADMGLSDAEIARQVGKSRSVVANTRRLLQLPKDRQAQVASGELNERQAIALLPLYQLPPPAREKILASYQGKNLAAPEKLTSDAIRQKYADSVAEISRIIQLIDPATPYTGDNIYHASCTDCACCIRRVKEMGDELRCLNPSCLEAKQLIVKRAILEQAKTVTGLDYLDPGIKYSWDQVSGFYGADGSMAVQIARNRSCPNLRLRYTEFRNDNYIDNFQNTDYCCLHPGTSKECACQKVAEQNQRVAERAEIKKLQAAKDQAASRLAKIFQQIPLPCLRAILYTEYRYEANKQKKVMGMQPEKLALDLAAHLIDKNISFNKYKPIETSQAELAAWLEKMGLPPLANPDDQDKIADLDHRLTRIEGWIAGLPIPITAEHLEAINGNLTNLANLAEDIYLVDDYATEEEDLQALLKRYDAAKSKLLDARERIEAAVALPKEIKSIRATLGHITAWLANPDPQIMRVLNNATNLAGDVWQLIYKHGETEELKALLADIEAAENQLRRLRHSGAAVKAADPQTQEVAS